MQITEALWLPVAAHCTVNGCATPWQWSSQLNVVYHKVMANITLKHNTLQETGLCIKFRIIVNISFIQWILSAETILGVKVNFGKQHMVGSYYETKSDFWWYCAAEIDLV